MADGVAIQRLDGRAQAEEEPQGWLTKAAEPREEFKPRGVRCGECYGRQLRKLVEEELGGSQESTAEATPAIQARIEDPKQGGFSRRPKEGKHRD